MKKSLAALAVLGAFGASAMAADVTLYGLVDYGFAYQHFDGDSTADSTDKFFMDSGMNSGSRFGLKGTEELGNGVTVGFVLENGFNADEGAFTTDGRIFDRESQVYIKSNFGTLSMGRVGQLSSANGTFGLLNRTSPFSSGWNDSVGQKFVTANGWGRLDNTVTYVTPDFAGFKVYAQYSFDKDSTKKVNSTHGTEGKASVDRYYAIGATFDMQNLQLVAIVDSTNYASNGDLQSAMNKVNDDDSLTFTIGGNYDFGVAKVYAMGQYFDNASGVGQFGIDANSARNKNGYTTTNGLEGFGLALGVGVPCFGGTAKAHVGYMDAEDVEDSKADISRWNLAVGYDYNLSKRTSLYTAAAYTKDSLGKNLGDRDPSTIEVIAGMIHRF